MVLTVIMVIHKCNDINEFVCQYETSMPRDQYTPESMIIVNGRKEGKRYILIKMRCTPKPMNLYNSVE